MSEDYSDAMHRHLESGVELERIGHYANASHLLGISAECAIKAILTKKRNPRGTQSLKAHLPSILDTLGTHSMFKNNEKLLAAIKKAARGLNQWRVDQRYANRAQFPHALILLEMDAAKKLCRLEKHFYRGIVL